MTSKKRPAPDAAKPVRRIRYHVACSLDGYIADEDGGADWIVDEPGIDFKELFAQFDTFLMGRLTYEPMMKMNTTGMGMSGKEVVVVSRTLRPEDHPDITIISHDLEGRVSELRARPGKDIWLFGGGTLFASLASAGLVDAVELGVMPVILGAGIPLKSAIGGRVNLRLTKSEATPEGILSLEYAVKH